MFNPENRPRFREPEREIRDPFAAKLAMSRTKSVRSTDGPDSEEPSELRTGGYRFFFYSSDRPEPAHIHVEEAGRTAKIRLRPIRVASSHGFSRAELGKLVVIVTTNHDLLLEEQNEFFSDEE